MLGWRSLFVLGALITGCSSSSGHTDARDGGATREDGGPTDAGARDSSGAVRDAASMRDSGADADAGSAVDAGVTPGSLATTVTQWGITWTFDKAYEVGTFVNGDFWVVGPVTVTSISPSPGNGRNGSIVNPTPKDAQPFDNRTCGPYDATLGVTLPLSLRVDSSLVSTISQPESLAMPNTSNVAPLLTAAVLTCLSAPPPEGSFRPNYTGTLKHAHNLADVNWELLPHLSPVAKTPALADVTAEFQRVWLDYLTDDYCSGSIAPTANLPNYGRDLAYATDDAALSLLLNYSQDEKKNLLVNFVQAGIDYYGVVESGGHWTANGGWAQGRKWPIVFAGFMLNDSSMLHVGDLSQPPLSLVFGEDNQTFYVAQSDINLAHVTAGGTTTDSQTGMLIGNYTQAQLGMPEFQAGGWNNPQNDEPNWTADTNRACCTASSWIGYILAAHVLGLKAAWHHDAIFDYMDRFASVQFETGATLPGNPFYVNMWEAYRATDGCSWVSSSPTDPASNGTRTNCP